MSRSVRRRGWPRWSATHRGALCAPRRARHFSRTQALRIEHLEPRQMLDAGPIVINEIMYNTSLGTPGQAGFVADNPHLEWIELYNRSASPVNLKGWKFNKGVPFDFDPATDRIMGAGSYLVVTADRAAFLARYTAVDPSIVVGSWIPLGSTDPPRLSNTDETIELSDAGGAQIDKVHYYDSGEWSTRVRGPLDYNHRGVDWDNGTDGTAGKTLELVNPGDGSLNFRLSNDWGQNWKGSAAPGGTPGARNSVYATNTAPIISKFQHLPVIPRSTDQVTVTAKVVDEAQGNGGVGVRLYYRPDGTATFTSVEMLDDGTKGDGLAGDGVYGAVLPAQANLTIVEMYVRATDASSNARTWPGPVLGDEGVPNSNGGQTANVLYQVDNSYDPNAVWTPGAVPVYRMVMTAANYTELFNMVHDGTNSEQSNAAMNGTFITLDGVGMEVRYEVAIRNRGHGSRNGSGNAQNYKVSFPADHTWMGLSGTDINYVNGYVQALGSTVYQLAGMEAPDQTGVQTRVNGTNYADTGGLMYSLYVGKEGYDGDFAANHYPGDSKGNLYVCHNVTGGADFGYPVPNNYRDNYIKQTNASDDDFSDIFQTAYVLSNPNNTPGVVYFQDVSQVIDPNQWARYIAVDYFLGNGESGLCTGVGDDYGVYRGVTDTRFKLVPWDMDSLLNIGSAGASPAATTSIFNGYSSVAGLVKLFNNDEFVRLYYQHLMDLASTIFLPANFNAMIERTLASWKTAPGNLPQSVITTAENFVVARRNHVLTEVPRGPLTVNANWPVSNGYPKATNYTYSLNGTANALTTQSVLVNGQLAQWTVRGGTWSFPNGAGLKPGLNRILVQAFDGKNGTGNEIDRKTIDIWCSVGGTQLVTSDITVDTTWTPDKTYSVRGTVTVQPGATLTIQPGTTVYFETLNAVTPTLIIKGRLVAEGTPYQQIRFTRFIKASPSNWGNIEFQNTTSDNRLSYCVVEYGVSTSGLIHLTNSNLTLDHVTLDRTDRFRINAENSSLVVRNSTFEQMFAPGTAPAGDDVSEQIRASYTTAPSGTLVIENNTFGTTTGHNDIIDVRGYSGGPVIEVRNNTFLGGGGNAMNLDGNAFIAGNQISHFKKDAFNTSPDNSDAITAGDSDLMAGHNYTAVGNIFYDLDHVAQVSEGSYLSMVSNTAVNVSGAGVYFLRPGGTVYGAGAAVDSAVFWNVPSTFGPLGPTTTLTINRSVLPAAYHSYGTGNTAEDPRLVDPAGGNFHFGPGSPALGTGPNGIDRGGAVSLGASISGEPMATTHRTDATLTVGGPGITAYKWRLDNWAYSNEVPVGTPITISGLAAGLHTVYVLGKDATGRWQTEANRTASRAWTVSASPATVILSEVLAKNVAAVPNGTTFPDIIELYNDGMTVLDLGGISLSDNAGEPRKFTFANGTMLAVGTYLKLFADSDTTAPGIHLGFSLKETGDNVVLTDSAARGGATLDSVEFGFQLPDRSIARRPDGSWGLATPTPGSANAMVRMGDTSKLRVNEWLANEQVTFNNDFVELYNGDSLPVDMGGFHVTDKPNPQPGKSTFPPLTFMAATSVKDLTADDDPGQGSDHLNFKLDYFRGKIAVLDPDLKIIDQVAYGPQTTDVSEGRTPNGTGTYAYQAVPNPEVNNDPVPQNVVNLSKWLRITEIIYAPPGGGDYEFIELKNIGGAVLDLSGVRITNGVDFTFPAGKTLAAGAYTLVVADLAKFTERYGAGPAALVAGVYTGGLNNVGEGINLLLPAPYDAGILRFSYSDSWYNLSSTGHSLVIYNANLAAATWDQKASWRPSAAALGSPGGPEPTAVARTVIINEVLAHQDVDNPGDWIELYNTTNNDINLGGWYLSDSGSNLQKFRIPDGTIIPRNGYKVFSEWYDFGKIGDPNAFALSELGDQVYLSTVGYLERVAFGANDNGTTLGRFVTSTGEEDFTPLSYPTMGAANAPPLVGPIVINEIMYNPTLGRHEYIELHNITGSDVRLYDPNHPENTWMFTEGVDYIFPTGAVIPAYGYALVIRTDEATFRRDNPGVPADVQIFASYGGGLSSAGEAVVLERPGNPEPPPEVIVPYYREDRVFYDNNVPWPPGADGTGASLERKPGVVYGNDPQNWLSSSVSGGTPGRSNSMCPAVGLSGPSIPYTFGDAVTYTVTYVDAAFDHSTLTAADVVLHRTGTANAAVSVEGAGTTYTVTLSALTGDGTLAITIPPGTGVNVAGYPAAAAGPSAAVDVHTTVYLSQPSSFMTAHGPITYSLAYGPQFTTCTLTPADITLNRTGTATGTVNVDGTGMVRTITISNVTGDGTLGLSIAAGTAADGLGGLAPAIGPSATFAVDNTRPNTIIGTPSVVLTKGGPVKFTVYYSDANFNSSTLTLADAGPGGRLTLNRTGTAQGTVTKVSGEGSTRTVTVDNITGDGTLGIYIAAGTATDLAGNPAIAAWSSGAVTVDNTPPAISLSGPSATAVTGGTITYTVTYSDPRFNSCTLSVGNITLNKTGTAMGTVAGVTGTGTTRTVTLTDVYGDGTLSISIAAGTASDIVGNLSPAAGPSAPVIVDNTAPTNSIGEPSVPRTRGGPVSYTVTYADTNFHASTLAVGNITLNATGTATGTLSVTGSGSTRTVAISNITGDGTLGISIAAGTGSDLSGNLTDAAGPSTTFIVDNTVPVVQSIVRRTTAPSTASPTPGASGVYFDVTLSEAVNGVDLTDFSLTLSGVRGIVTTVSGSGASYMVLVTNVGGVGTLRLNLVDDGSIADLAGNPLGGPAVGDGNFTSGELYSVDTTYTPQSVLTAPPIPQALIYWLEPVSGGGATADYTVSGSYTSGDTNPDGGYKVSINSLPAPSATIKFNLYASIGGYDTNAANDTFISGLLDILNRPAPGSALPGQPGPVSLVAAFMGAAGYSSGQANRDVDGGGGVDLGGDLAIATPPTATGDVWVRPKNASTGVAGTSRNANGRTDVLIGSFFYTLGAGVSGGQSAQVWTAAVVNTGAGGTNSANSWRKDGTYTKREEYGTNVGSAPAVTISVPASVSIGSSISHQEGDVGPTDYVFPVTLSKPCTQPVLVTVDTVDGTATLADNDYQALHQVVTFAPGETSKNVTVRVNGDMRLESDESFTVTLSAPLYSGAAAPGLISLGNSVGTATIVNDDQAGLVWIAPLSADVLEGNQGTTPLTFTVGLSSPSDSTITVDVDTADGTATVANNDYQPLQHYTVTLNPGQMSAKVTVTALGDAVLENDETFTVGLSNLTGTGYALGRSTATGTILNDDGALVLGDSGSSLLIVADPASPNVAQMFFNGAATPTYRIDTTRVWDAAGLRRFVLQGGAGDDLLTLDFAYDPALGVRSPLPADGLIFTGGGSVAGDSLVWKNSTGTLVASPYPAAPEVPTGIQLTSATTPTVTLDNVGFVSFQLADCVQNNNCLTLDGVRLTVNQDNAISANTAVEVKSGGVLDLGNRTASVRSLTLTDGRVINGSLQSAASTLGNGEVGARLTGGSVTKNGTGTVVLSGQNSYTGGTQVVSQTLVVTSADALPKGGDLTIGPGATLVLPVGLIGSAGAGRAVAAAAVALPNPTPVAATAPAASVMAVSVQPALQPVAIVAPATIAAAAAGAPAPIPVALRATASPAASHSTIAATPRTPAIISAKRIPKVTAAHGTKRTAAHDAALAAHKTVDAVPESWLALVEQAVLSRRPSRETGHAPPGVDAVLAAYGL